MRPAIYCVLAHLILIAGVNRADAELQYTPIFLGSNANAPAINDSGEVAYIFNDDIYSTTRGLLVGTDADVDGSRIGLGNDGEVVYSDATSGQQLHSTVRGLISSGRTSAPSISLNTGEVVYRGLSNDTPPFIRSIESTQQGTIDSRPSLLFALSAPAVNDLGEVVYGIRDLSTPFTRIMSSTRGFLTPDGADAFEPAINNQGEVVWSAFDDAGRNQIFSSTRGQLTSFSGSHAFFSAILPAINSRGDVVFRGDANVNGEHVPGIYLVAVPEPNLSMTLGSAIVGAVAFCRRRNYSLGW